MRAGKAAAAWDILAPYEPRHAGRPQYDYLLGIAALESGRYSRASFILERVLVVNPGHSAARLEMARAHFALGDYERAQQEFRAVLATDPPPQVRALVQRYLGRPSSAAAALRAYVDFALGRDSNVNAAASSGGIFAAEPLRSRDADTFAALGAGASFSSALDARHELFGALDFSQRMHDDLHAFDSRSAEVQLGLQRRLDERDSLRLLLEHGEHDLDHSAFRRTRGAALRWTRRHSATRVSIFGEGLRIRYADPALRTLSSNLYLAGVGGAHPLDASASTQAILSLYAGHDEASAGRPDGDRRVFGLSAVLQRGLGAGLEASIGVSLVDSRYRRFNAAAGGRREDRYVSAELALSWQLARDWLLRPQLSRMHNRSNLPFSEYGRTEASLTLRRSFP